MIAIVASDALLSRLAEVLVTAVARKCWLPRQLGWLVEQNSVIFFTAQIAIYQCDSRCWTKIWWTRICEGNADSVIAGCGACCAWSAAIFFSRDHSNIQTFGPLLLPETPPTICFSPPSSLVSLQCTEAAVITLHSSSRLSRQDWLRYRQLRSLGTAASSWTLRRKIVFCVAYKE